MIETSSFNEIIKKIEWKNIEEQDKVIAMALSFESDLEKNLMRNYLELNKKYSEFTSGDWLMFLRQPQLSIHLLSIGAVVDEVGERKLKSQIEGLMTKIYKADSIERDDAKTLTNFLSVYRSLSDKKLKDIRSLLKAQGQTHTFLFVNKGDPDNSFKVIDSNFTESGANSNDKAGSIIEIYNTNNQEFKGFLFVNNGIPTISPTKVTVFPNTVFKQYLEKYKRNFTGIHNLKTHNINLPEKILKEGIELYVKEKK